MRSGKNNIFQTKPLERNVRILLSNFIRRKGVRGGQNDPTFFFEQKMTRLAHAGARHKRGDPSSSLPSVS